MWFSKSMEHWRSTEKHIHTLRFFALRHNGERRVRKAIASIDLHMRILYSNVAYEMMLTDDHVPVRAGELRKFDTTVAMSN